MSSFLSLAREALTRVSASRLVLLVILGLGSGSVLAASDDSGLHVSQKGLFKADIRPVSAEIPIGKFHRWHILLTDPSGTPLDAQLTFSASMPDHGHGLPYRTTIRRLELGRYLVEGVQFNMGGEWTVTLQVTSTAFDTIEFPLNLAY